MSAQAPLASSAAPSGICRWRQVAKRVQKWKTASARTPVPAIYVIYKSSAGDCPLQCTLCISDAPLATGQGNHGGFSRAETRNFMAAMGPDFKTGFADPAPVSNADIAPTLARVMGFALPARGKLAGRVASEALTGAGRLRSKKG